VAADRSPAGAVDWTARRTVTEGPTAIGLTIAAIAAAEEILVFISLPLGAAAHGIMTLGLLLQTTVTRPSAVRRCLAGLALVPLLRLLSLALVQPDIPIAVWGALAASAFLVATAMVIRALEMRPADLGLAVPKEWSSALLALGVVGIASLVASRASSSVALGGAELAVPAYLVISAVSEELAFRGVIQGTLRRAVGDAAAVLYSSVAFSVLYLATFSLAFIASIVALGLVLGWVTARSRSIWPAMVCHVAFNLAAALVWPGLGQPLALG
jgi:membrane protease YdiL (CAAX protease family)